MGGPRRSAKESVDALEEAMSIIRAFFSPERSVRVEGQHYSVVGAHPGPRPAHEIGIWLGAYGPRMLRITGSKADGWLPSLGGRYLGREEAMKGQRAIDEAAKASGRDPGAIERAVNIVGLGAEAASPAEQLARTATELRFSTLIVSVPEDDPIGFVRRLGEDVAPRVRALVG
jgi:alkanesulfonate monooxygenase SsuD/methylene tetrahydromethanopterin reductase-like flavin-dependent oxidoreductase (luciferase family)